MEYNSIYKNGKLEYFFLKINSPLEFNFIQPYFFVTDSDNHRKGNIMQMDCLFSNSVWQGKQRHGYGYSASADVYGTLIDIIETLYADSLSDETKRELSAINTHNEKLTLSENALRELQRLNEQTLYSRF